MITTIVTCDKCKQEIHKGNQIWNVKVLYSCGAISLQLSTDIRHWCRTCLEETGIVPIFTTGKKIDPPKMTIEDMIREIVAEAKEE
jgi:hypothetical protein